MCCVLHAARCVPLRCVLLLTLCSVRDEANAPHHGAPRFHPYRLPTRHLTPALEQVGVARAGDSIETIQGEPFTRRQFAELFEVLPPHGVVRMAASAREHSLGPRHANRRLDLGLARSAVVSGSPPAAEGPLEPSPQRRIRDTRWRAASAEARPRQSPGRDARVTCQVAREVSRSPVNVAAAPAALGTEEEPWPGFHVPDMT